MVPFPQILAQSEGVPLPLGSILMGLVGGLALFLFGLDQMSDALKSIAGDGLKTILSRLTRNRFTSALAGAFITALIQSSSVTTVLVVGFISAGLLTLPQSIGVIMGANIGTTITAQIIAFKITHYALAPVAIGFFTQFVTTNEKIRRYGRLVMGLGLIFFGMQLMSMATSPLRTYPPFIESMQQLDNPFAAILLAAVFTALVQSSSATTGLVITLASQGFISLETGIALTLGANIGTCITAGLASLGKPREAVRAAVVHVLFNVTGVVIWLGFIPQLAAMVTWFSPVSEQLSAAERLAVDTPRQIANAHTLFNVANTLLLIGFTTPMAWLVMRILPDRPKDAPTPAEPKYLDTILIQTPVLAMDVVRKEIGRLGAAALHMMRGAFDPVIKGSPQELDALEAMDDNVDALHGAIVTYLARLSQENLTDRQTEQLQDYLAASNYIESIGDLIETNLVDAGRQRLRAGIVVSDETERVLRELNREVVWAMERSIRAIVSVDIEAAREVAAAKARLNRLAVEAERQLSRRLAADEPKRLATFRYESEIMEYLRRMYYFSKRIAKLVTETNVQFAQNDQSGSDQSGSDQSGSDQSGSDQPGEDQTAEPQATE